MARHSIPAKVIAIVPMNSKISIIQPDGSETVLYEPTTKQLEFHSRLETNVLFWGGRGSGKSMALRWEAHARAMATPNFNYAILRRTFPELQKSHLIHVPREMKILGGSYNHTHHVANYPNGSKGFFSHCNTEEDVLNLLSSEFAWMGFDELSTFEWDMFTKLSASVRVPKDSGLIAMVRAATNPLGPSAQKVLQYFVNRKVDPEDDPDYNPNDWYSIHANLVDNPYIDQAQYKKRFSGLASHVRKAWVEGEFVLENALFDFWPTKEGKPWHVIQDIDLEKVIKASTIYRTIDSGWFPDPTVVLWIAHLGNRYIIFHEELWNKTTAAEIAGDIKEIDKQLGVKKVAMTYCDPSMDINTGADVRTIKEIYEDNGIAMECSINDRAMFATAIHQALAEQAGEETPRIQIYSYGNRGCPYLTKSIPQMRFDQKHSEKMADHKDDHAVVALAYFLMSHASDAMSDIPGGYGTHLRPWMREKPMTRFVLGQDNVRSKRNY